MDNLYKFPYINTIEEEAATWLIRLDGEQVLSLNEKKDLKEWLSRSPTHRDELHEQNKFWGNQVLTEMLIPKVESVTNKGTRKSILPFWHGLFPSHGLKAVTVAFSVAIVGLLVFFQSNDVLLKSNGVYTTKIGEQTRTVLADGSVIELNTNSQVNVEYGEDFRNIRLLKGEAHFIVAKNLQRPLRVYAKYGRVEAVGTEFTIHIKQRDVDVLVTEGRVELSALTQQNAGINNDSINSDNFYQGYSKKLTTIDVGQSATFTPFTSLSTLTSDSLAIVNNKDLNQSQAWRNGWLIFSGESLEQVLEEMKRYSNVSIDILDSEIKQLPIGGRFKVGDINGVLFALENNFDIKITRLNESHIQLSKSL
ncbi:MAG: FecR domain-containing protein [Colwellia sp.]